MAYDLVVLDDDRHAIPPYDAIILVSGRLIRVPPDAVAALRGLAGGGRAETMRRMNAAVDKKEEPPAAVAQQFLDKIRRKRAPKATGGRRA